jgi:nicotinamidase-related amidase
MRAAVSAEIVLPLRHYRLYPPELWLGEQVEPTGVDLRTTAFCLVDVYGLGHDPDDAEAHEYPALSSMSSVNAESEVVRKAIKPALDVARNLGLPIVYVNNAAPRIEFSRGALGSLLRRVTGYPMEELLAEREADDLEYHRGDGRFVEISRLIAPQTGDYFVRKHAYSGFFETRLDSLLRNLSIKTLIFVGFSLDVCLMCTMLDALNLNYDVILLRDCTLASDLPEEAPTFAFTRRMVTWAEMVVARTATSVDFIAAARPLLQASQMA